MKKKKKKSDRGFKVYYRLAFRWHNVKKKKNAAHLFYLLKNQVEQEAMSGFYYCRHTWIEILPVQQGIHVWGVVQCSTKRFLYNQPVIQSVLQATPEVLISVF